MPTLEQELEAAGINISREELQARIELKPYVADKGRLWYGCYMKGCKKWCRSIKSLVPHEHIYHPDLREALMVVARRALAAGEGVDSVRRRLRISADKLNRLQAVVIKESLPEDLHSWRVSRGLARTKAKANYGNAWVQMQRRQAERRALLEQLLLEAVAEAGEVSVGKAFDALNERLAASGRSRVKYTRFWMVVRRLVEMGRVHRECRSNKGRRHGNGGSAWLLRPALPAEESAEQASVAA